MDFFRIGYLIPLIYFLFISLFIYLFIFEICRNYMSIIITIVSNITVSVSRNSIFFGFFMPMSHGANKKTRSSVSLHLPGLFVVLQELLYQSSFAVIRLFVKDNAFSKKIRFFLLAHCWSVLILLFCLCVFLRVVFLQFCHHEITNLNLLFFFRIPRKLSLRFILPP